MACSPVVQVNFLISLSEAYFQTIYSSLCHCFARDWVSDVAWYCGYDHEARRSSPAPKAPRGNCRVEARRLGDTYGANPWRRLRGMPAVAARFRGARPTMVPRQSATSGRTVVTRISLGFAPPSAHRYKIISYRTPVARVSDAGNPDLTSGAIRQAGIFSEGIFTVSKVARAGSHFGGLGIRHDGHANCTEAARLYLAADAS